MLTIIAALALAASAPKADCPIPQQGLSMEAFKAAHEAYLACHGLKPYVMKPLEWGKNKGLEGSTYYTRPYNNSGYSEYYYRYTLPATAKALVKEYSH